MRISRKKDAPAGSSCIGPRQIAFAWLIGPALVSRHASAFVGTRIVRRGPPQPHLMLPSSTRATSTSDCRSKPVVRPADLTRSVTTGQVKRLDPPMRSPFFAECTRRDPGAFGRSPRWRTSGRMFRRRCSWNEQEARTRHIRRWGSCCAYL